MTDIVEWLRKEAELVALDRLSEAADEIERLRRRLNEVDAQLTAEDHIHARECMALRAEKEAEIARLKHERHTTKRMLRDILEKHGGSTPATPHYGLGRGGMKVVKSDD
jgi:chromosome segregation ATPase